MRDETGIRKRLAGRNDIPSSGNIDRTELLTYIATMSEELAILAQRAGQIFPAHHFRLASDQLRHAVETERTRCSMNK